MTPFDPEKHAQWEADRGRIKARKASSRQIPMQAILEQLQSPHLLRSWLQTKQPNEIVGAAQTPDETVLANFLWETLGICVIAFGVELWPLDRDPLELPTWCGEFATVEGEHSRAGDAARGNWTAVQALAMLDETEVRIERREPNNQARE